MLGPINSLDIDSLLVHLPKRAQIPQSRNDIYDFTRDEIHLSLSGESANPKSDRRVSHVFFSA
jgi:hypothetical protein